MLLLARRTEVRLDDPASRDGYPLRGFEGPVRDAGFPIALGARRLEIRPRLNVRWCRDVAWEKTIQSAPVG